MVVDVFLKGRLLARYTYEHHRSEPQRGDAAIIALAKQDLLQERLVDEPHLEDLDFEVHPS